MKSWKNKLTTGLLLLPLTALASDPTPIIAVLIGLPLLVFSVVFFIITFFQAYVAAVFHVIIVGTAVSIFFGYLDLSLHYVSQNFWISLPIFISIVGFVISVVRITKDEEEKENKVQ